MKVLALASLSDAPSYRKENISSPVDQWRIYRPYSALKKYANWQIDFDKVIIPDFSRDMKITDETYQQVYDRVKEYDMVVSSYFTNGSMYSLIRVICEKLNVPFVMDVDDDWFDLPDDNPVWTKIGKKEWVNIMLMLEDAPFITTTNDYLAAKIVAHRKDKAPHTVVVLPNMISMEEYSHPSYDNGDKVVIGWMGGASHYLDFHESNVLPAIRNIMHKYKNVELHVCGMVIDEYLPKARVKTYEPQRGLQWLDLFKQLRFDIGIAPLLGREFDKSKSDIKWQEYSMMGAATVASKVGPYQSSIRHNVDGLLVDNTVEAWERALERLVKDKPHRKSMSKLAKARVASDRAIENNWKKLSERMRLICEIYELASQPSSDPTTSKSALILS